VLRRGTLAWLQGEVIRVRPLKGGASRAQAGAGEMDVQGLDHDGRRLVVVGFVDPEAGMGATELRLVELGSRRPRVLRNVTFGEQYHVMRDPVLSRGHVDVVDAFVEDVGYDLVRLPLRGDGRQERRGVGLRFTKFARGGGAAAYAASPGLGACQSGGPEYETDDYAPASCRIVRAGADPFGARERLLPPTIVLDATERAITGRLMRRVMREGRAVARRGVAGVAVTVVPLDAKPGARGQEARTDAQGRFSVEPGGKPGALFGAVTVGRPRAWAEDPVALQDPPDAR